MNISKLITNMQNSQCQKCTALSTIRKNIVVSKGNMNADTIIVGQNPGREEDDAGTPFIGPAGRHLDRIIDDSGYDKNKDFFFTNSILCITPNNSDPNEEYIQSCQTNLITLTGQFKKIIALGKVASKAVIMAYKPNLLSAIRISSMNNIITNGNPIILDNEKVLFITYHPSFLLRNNMVDQTHLPYQQVLDEIKYAKSYVITKKKSSDNQRDYKSMGLF